MKEVILSSLSDIEINTARYEIEIYSKTGLLRNGAVKSIMKEFNISELSVLIAIIDNPMF